MSSNTSAETSPPKSSLKSLIVVVVAAAIGLAFAYFAGSNGQQAGPYPVMFVCALVALAVNWLVYIPSMLAQTEKYYDLTGAITYISVIAAAWLLSDNPDTRALVVAAMVIVWCSRLGLFLFKRISKDGKDSRFDKIKVNPSRFLVAWTLQAQWAIFTAAAAVAIIASAERLPLDIWFWIGAATWVAGFLIEVIADNQKSRFKADPANEDAFIDTGLWAWSQHPNYFGEIVLWIGIAIMAIPLLSGLSWLVLLSPIFVILLLTKLSGIPMLDEKAKKRWGDDPAWQKYYRETPKLIPMPPKS